MRDVAAVMWFRGDLRLADHPALLDAASAGGGRVVALFVLDPRLWDRAGCGADAAPYFRIFNPVGQGLKFDPAGEYVRRWVPELSHLDGKAAHEPWKHGGADGYPTPIVDHAEARREALRRYDAIR